MKIIAVLLVIEITIILASETDDLNRDGIWVPWNSRKSGVPPNAVVGGRDENGNIYVIRADHYQDGVSYRGIIPGRYSPNLSYASIAYYNKEYRYKHFEILTHKNSFWQDKTGQPNYLIPGGEDSGRNTIYICRAWVNSKLIPGKLHSGSCWIADNGKEYQKNPNFPYFQSWETLKRVNNNL